MIEPAKARRIGYGLLAPGMALFALRAAFGATGHETPGALSVALAIGGSLSLVGLLLVLWSHWRNRWRIRVLLAVAIVLGGHFIVSRLMDGGLGPAMVYLGTGFLASIRFRTAAHAGMLAGAGTILRDSGDPAAWMHVLILAGALALAIQLAWGAAQAEPAADTNP